MPNAESESAAEIASGEQPAPAAPEQTLAAASLTLGLLSLLCLCGPLTGLPAVITGHWALHRMKQQGASTTGRRKAIAGLVLGYGASVCIVVGIALLPWLATQMLYSDKMDCKHNLKRIATACQEYAADHRQVYPPNLAVLHKMYHVPLEVFTCPCTDDEITSPDRIDEESSYVYVGAGLSQMHGVEPRLTPVCYDKPGNHKEGDVYVLYLDGHVEWHEQPPAFIVPPEKSPEPFEPAAGAAGHPPAK